MPDQNIYVGQGLRTILTSLADSYAKHVDTERMRLEFEMNKYEANKEYIND